jgi:alcohol dehydrogenase, propanol-preferring
VAAHFLSTFLACPTNALPYWGSIPELVEVVSLAKAGKIKMLVEHFPLDRAAEVYRLLHDGKIAGRAVITPNG